MTSEREQQIELRFSSQSTVNILRVAMTPERWQQIEPILHGALECAAAGRSSYLDAACGEDSPLRQQVYSLIAAYQQASGFIESPAVEVAAKIVGAEGVLFPDQMVAHFRVLSRLGQGGMGVVYVAEDTKLGRKVALKLLLSEFAQNKDRLRRFAHEARATSALNHPNIVTLYEIIESPAGHHALVEELVEGRTLRDLVREPLAVDSILHWGKQVAEALAAAHEAGIVHRDIKPENIVVRNDGYVKVLDFGLARLSPGKLTAVSKDLSNPSELIGTVAYMSPEQARGDQVDSPTDIFSLGIVLYQLATAQHPFPADSILAILEAIKSQPPQAPSLLNPKVPAGFQRLILQMLSKEAALRPTASQVVETLGRLAGVMTAAGEKKHFGLFWGIGAAAAIFCLLAIAFFYRNQPVQAPAAALTAVPITAEEGFKSYPSFSPDGKQVAYSWKEKEENEDIYIKVIGGGSPLRLTSDPAEDTAPSWSPDGGTIAFLRRSKLDKEELGLFVMPPPAANGGPERNSPERKVANLNIPVSRVQTPRIAWTPDSRCLIFPDAAGVGGSTALYLLSLATGEKKRLTAPSSTMYGDSSPAVSPDGKLLAFVRYVGGNQNELYVLPLTKGFEPGVSLRRLPTEQQWLKDPAWTADGQHLIYFAYNLTPQNIAWPLLTAGRLWRVAISGLSPPTPLAIVGDIGDMPAISARANRLAYRVFSFDTDIWRLDIPDTGKTVTRHRFITSTRPDVTPQYSPDGKRIAFASVRSGASEIWLCEQNGSNPTQLTWLKAHSEKPSWFPDGRRIVFSSNKDSVSDLYVIDVSGGSPRRLTDDPERDVAPSVSHDGRWIYFASRRSGRWQIWQMPAEGGQAVQLTQEGGYAPVESPDGRFLFYLAGKISEVWKMNIEGGGATRAFSALSGNNNFAVAKDGICFVGTGEGGKAALRFYAFATGYIQTIIDLESSFNGGVSVSPDGHSILYSQIGKTDSDLMVVENFH